MPYRNSMQIMTDVLLQTSQYGLDGANKSNLIQKANLSHSRLKQFLNNLINSGLINDIVYHNHQTFVITPKGLKFLEEYRNFVELAGSFGLEL
jgi:predicted transcriptional regulator